MTNNVSDVSGEFDNAICYDLSYFKNTMRELRKSDDNIIPLLNAITARDRDSDASCTDLFKKLVLSNDKRERFAYLRGFD